MGRRPGSRDTADAGELSGRTAEGRGTGEGVVRRGALAVPDEELRRLGAASELGLLAARFGRFKGGWAGSAVRGTIGIALGIEVGLCDGGRERGRFAGAWEMRRGVEGRAADDGIVCSCFGVWVGGW